jgi:hypothetical protein
MKMCSSKAFKTAAFGKLGRKKTRKQILLAPIKNFTFTKKKTKLRGF